MKLNLICVSLSLFFLGGCSQQGQTLSGAFTGSGQEPSSSAAPNPTPTPSPTSTPVSAPSPTPTPTPVSAPSPTPTPSPKPTPVPTPAPTPVPTPSPTPITGACASGLPCSLGWYQIPNTSIQSLCPAYPEIQGTSGCASVMAAWSGGLFDTKRNRFILHGGGHVDYYGNEIYAIDFNANPIAPILVKDASHGSAVSNVGSSPEAFNDGTPNARHTYNGWLYLPTQDSYLLYGAGLSPIGNFTDGQWLFSPLNLSWTQQHPSTHPTTAQTGSIPQHAYDPVTDTVYFLEGNVPHFWQMTPSTGAWTDLSDNTYACGNDDETTAIDPVRRLYACAGSGNLQTVSLNSPYTVVDDSSAPGCSALANAPAPGFVYDPVQRLFVGYANGNTVYTYNPATHSCSSVTSYSGGPTTFQTNGTFGRFQYAPSLGGFVYVGSISTNTWFLRLTP